MYLDAIGPLIRGQDLTQETAASVMTQIMEGALTPAQMGALLAALAAKGETAEELAGFATVLRAKAVPVAVEGDTLDTCGTGGSGHATHNVSTMVAFLLAACGARVAKHGNRASTGKCGSMDVLEALEVPIELSPEAVATLIEEVSIGFMYAPRHHPAMRHVGPVRRELGVRSCFNFLGPLANPAGATHQLLGVSDRTKAPMMLLALKALGTKGAMLVHGSDGLDEVTLTGPTTLFHLDGERVVETEVHPEYFGLTPVPLSALAGGDPEENRQAVVDVLGGRRDDAVRDQVLVNAALALCVAGIATDAAAGFALASSTLASGAAWERFERYRARAQELA